MGIPHVLVHGRLLKKGELQFNKCCLTGQVAEALPRKLENVRENIFEKK